MMIHGGGLYTPGECNVNYHRGAIFTVELGALVENGFDLGLKDYPIFDETYRTPLNNKIIDHFYFREIGQETPGLFKRFLNRRMNEIIPFYNQLYKSTLLDINPLANVDMTTTGNTQASANENRDYKRTENAEAKSKNETENDSQSKARTLVSNTPQMQLSGRDDYASTITDAVTSNSAIATSDNTTTSTTTGNDTTQAATTSTEDYITHVTGLSGITASNALLQYRNTFLNIDMLVIDELNDLFMGLYTDYWNAL